jgi:pterin-4a-carbinolamine dehydratase
VTVQRESRKMSPSIPEQWQLNERPPILFRRFDFDAYAQTRRFLDLLAQESERTGCYPDLSFGPRHVNVTLRLDSAGAIDEASQGLALAANDYARRARDEIGTPPKGP